MLVLLGIMMVPWKAVFVLINVGIAWNRDCTLESCIWFDLFSSLCCKNSCEEGLSKLMNEATRS